MDKFIDVVFSSEFAIAIVFGFIIAFVIATIVQDVIDTVMDNNHFESFVTVDEEPYIGCTVYDSALNIIGTFCGIHDDSHGVIVTVQNNKIYYYYSVLEELSVLQQE